jgi:hypothetical protein
VVVSKNIVASFMRDLIKLFNEVEKENDACGRGRLGKISLINKGLGRMDDKVSSTWNCNAELAIREKIFNYLIMEDAHDERASKTAKSGADAKGANAGEIIRIFIKGNEIVGGEGGKNRRGAMVFKDEPEEISKGGEVGMEEVVVGLNIFVSMEGKSTPYIYGVCERTGGGTFTHFTESSKDMLRSEGGVRNVGIVSNRSRVCESVIGNVRGESFCT